MRETGLQEAIRAAGGIGALARKLGISQPSVSNWTRVPADRIVAIESLTGVSRAILRPDLYGDGAPTDADLPDDVEAARAQEYALLATLLARAPDQALLDRLATLRGDATPIGVAHAALAEAASRTDAGRAAQEYFDLFIGIGRGELLPYASYYLTGFLNERPLARLREDLAELSIERAADQSEPEDHAAILCEVMAGLVSRRFAAEPGAGREVFRNHMMPWLGRFFADLQRAEAANFYRSVGALGLVFMDIEEQACALAA